MQGDRSDESESLISSASNCFKKTQCAKSSRCSSLVQLFDRQNEAEDNEPECRTDSSSVSHNIQLMFTAAADVHQHKAAEFSSSSWQRLPNLTIQSHRSRDGPPTPSVRILHAQLPPQLGVLQPKGHIFPTESTKKKLHPFWQLSNKTTQLAQHSRRSSAKAKAKCIRKHCTQKRAHRMDNALCHPIFSVVCTFSLQNF